MTDAEKLEKLRRKIKQLEKTIADAKELFHDGASISEIYNRLTREKL